MYFNNLETNYKKIRGSLEIISNLKHSELIAWDSDGNAYCQPKGLFRSLRRKCFNQSRFQSLFHLKTLIRNACEIYHTTNELNLKIEVRSLLIASLNGINMLKQMYINDATVNYEISVLVTDILNIDTVQYDIKNEELV